MQLCAADHAAIPLYTVTSETYADILAKLTMPTQNYLLAQDFTGGLGQALFAPDGADGFVAIVGLGSRENRRRGRFHLANGAQKLPSGVYRLATDLPLENPEYEILGWCLAGYKFDKYAKVSGATHQLVTPDWVDAHWISTMVQSEFLCRDLVNTPASDMGPEELEQAVRSLASVHGAMVDVTTGDALLKQNFPMIHAVGRASTRAPRLIDLRWGQTGPKVTLVGKGVCFDTGGLNLKPGTSMGLMKKDMGGAANTIALAAMIMGLGLNVQLRLLVPAVENSVSGNSFRPQDILTSRKGYTVEINNTDAEGRLVLADALAYASEEEPDIVISMATLTGAARVAVGPDLAPFFSGNPMFAADLKRAAVVAQDPVWEMPFWDPYEKMIEPGIADLDNAPSGGQAGAITAALFLRRFVSDATRYVHFDIYSWSATSQPGRPKGGITQGPRAIFSALSHWIARHG